MEGVSTSLILLARPGDGVAEMRGQEQERWHQDERKENP